MLGLGGATSPVGQWIGSPQKDSLRSLGCRPALIKRRQFEGRLLRYWRLLARKLAASRKREHLEVLAGRRSALLECSTALRHGS
jgi:hypothetical protein